MPSSTQIFNGCPDATVASGVHSAKSTDDHHSSPMSHVPTMSFNEKASDHSKHGEHSWIPKNLASGEGAIASNPKDQEFIKYRLNNPRITKKGDKTVSESMCNAYFEQRRNVLTQLLNSFAENDVVIHPLMKKLRAKNSRSKTAGSRFRGVSKNKLKWQVMIMGNFKKFYIGGLKTEEEAAKLYDKLAIFYHGMEAKTNFQYTKREVEILISEPVPT